MLSCMVCHVTIAFTELRNLQGGFNISDVFVSAYTDMTSVTYTALRDQIKAGVRWPVVTPGSHDIVHVCLLFKHSFVQRKILSGV